MRFVGGHIENGNLCVQFQILQIYEMSTERASARKMKEN